MYSANFLKHTMAFVYLCVCLVLSGGEKSMGWKIRRVDLGNSVKIDLFFLVIGTQTLSNPRRTEAFQMVEIFFLKKHKIINEAVAYKANFGVLSKCIAFEQ